ncbi:uncharacterized protein METZ01_LOCUS240838 [marine metagenome]|uniref:Tetratricopeptide repeat protein n=1 Tax=marine metagenome TaxID=408172 RepID=A0A382HKT5_9ZZZZ
MRNYLGAALMEAGQYAEAEAVYRRDLKWNHKNGWSMFGLHKALRAQGKSSEAVVAKQQFEIAWQHADIELTQSRL